MVLRVFEQIFKFIWDLANIKYEFDGFEVSVWESSVFVIAVAIVANRIFPKKAGDD